MKKSEKTIIIFIKNDFNSSTTIIVPQKLERDY